MRIFIAHAIVFLYLFGTPVSSDEMWTSLFEQNLQNAQDGDADAQYEVGIMYLKGQGVDANRKQARDWLNKAAQQDNDKAVAKLKRMGRYEKRFKKTLQAANDGDADARYDVALMYLKGKGTPIDNKEALAWLKRAADADVPKAKTRLGIFYYKGEAGKPQPKKAYPLFTAEAHDNVLAQYYLGEMYASGQGVEQDYAKAIGWYRKSADGGFQWAEGKLINIEEEQRMLSRKQQRMKQRQETLAKAEKAEPKAQVPAPQAKAKTKSQAQAGAKTKAKVKTKATAATPKAQPKRVAKRQPKAKPKPKTSLERVLDGQWARNNTPVEFLPSVNNDCEPENQQVVCYSRILEQSRTNQVIKYRVKSVISAAKNRKQFTVDYKNLVLEVISHAEESEDSDTSGYDGLHEQGYKVRTGWTKSHVAECKFTSGNQINCTKDGTYNMTIALDAERDTDTAISKR